jgi:integrase
MKGGRQHRVPLSDLAIELLEALPSEKGSEFMFIGGKPGAGLSNMAMLELLRGMRPGYVPHGFRSTFKDWCSETTNYATMTSEAALAHAVGDKTEAAYRRGDLFEKRRRLMRDWARFATTKPAEAISGKLIPLRAKTK